MLFTVQIENLPLFSFRSILNDLEHVSLPNSFQMSDILLRYDTTKTTAIENRSHILDFLTQCVKFMGRCMGEMSGSMSRLNNLYRVTIYCMAALSPHGPSRKLRGRLAKRTRAKHKGLPTYVGRP